MAAGSNLDPELHLVRAVRALRDRYGALKVSNVYRNPPVGIGGGHFLNLVLGFETTGTAHEVRAELDRLEREAGRGEGAARGGPRTLDLDLLLYGDAVIRDGRIDVPHPDIGRYAFVLRPLAELAPGLRHPESGRSMAELWAAFGDKSHPLERADLPAG